MSDLADLPSVLFEPVVRAALAEDLGRAGDVTAALVPAGARLRAQVRARGAGVIAGLGPARLAAGLVDPALHWETVAPDGSRVERGQTVAALEGSARSMLTAERTMLNFIGRLSGVATLTAAYVAAVAGTRARIAATRKTTPGLRALEKHAVRLGGGWPHRYGLDDAILIKDNHVAAFGGSVRAAVEAARAAAGHLTPIEVEIDRLDQLEDALAAGPQVVMLDNFALADLAEAVRRTAGRAVLEASGGVTLETVGAIAATGVDVISVGALTHSAPNFDVGLDAVP